jgi:hypothetical protein
MNGSKNHQKRGKDRAKHDGGKDASGHVPDGAKHPESPQSTSRAESGEARRKPDQGDRSVSETGEEDE